MRKIILLILLSVLANLALLSVGHGQSSVGVQGYVPETDLNRNSNKVQIILDENKPVFKENKYLYFFEKALGLQDNLAKTTINLSENQTVFDRVAGSVLMWGILLILAIILWFLLRFIDKIVTKYRVRAIKTKHLISKSAAR